MAVPKFDELFKPLIDALRNLGGSASIAELEDEVARVAGLSESDLGEMTHDGVQSRFQYRLAWARSYLKGFGLVDNSERGVWALTPRGKDVSKIDAGEIKRFVRSRKRSESIEAQPDERTEGQPDERDHEDPADRSAAIDWRQEVLKVLLSLPPAQFERLCQRILRESGFTQVEVTGRSGDGGIDGVGTVRLGGLLSFPVLFQCKRVQSSVGAGVVRDFRGAMVGRADRGLILTTGAFTREARHEAARDGAPPVDLVDRELLLDKLRELRLGLDIAVVEQVRVNPEWFRSV